MISDRGMTSLRTAAALAHSVPQVRLRVLHGDRLLTEVSRSPAGDVDDAVRRIAPCGFRDAVARAHGRRRAGEQLQFLSLPAGVDPTVEIRVPDGDRVLPGGIVRVGVGSVWMHAVPIARSKYDCLAVIGDLGLDGLGCHQDAPLGVTVLHTASPAGDAARARVALDRLEQAAARCAVAELEEFLRVGPGARPAA